MSQKPLKRTVLSGRALGRTTVVLRAELERLRATVEAGNDLARSLAGDNLSLRARVAEVERERDAYKRAKEENDERFMLERDEARARVAELEQDNSDRQKHYDDTVEHMLKLREALEFYALPEHVWVRSAALAADKGYTARAALKDREKPLESQEEMDALLKAAKEQK